MNSRKKIINTLKKADKASVEKFLAEETKKNEIFARAVRKANIEKNEYTDVVNGVEKYERRINMTRIASIAAAAVLMAGSIGGGAYIFGKNNVKGPDGEISLSATTTENTSTNNVNETTFVTTTGNVTTKASSSTVTSVNTVVTAVVSTAVSNNNTSGTDSVAGGSAAGNNVKASGWSVTKEELTNKFNNYANSFNRFSADYTESNGSYPNALGVVYKITTKGSMCLDKVNEIMSETNTTFYDNEISASNVRIVSGGYYSDAHTTYMDSLEGLYNMVTLEKPKCTYFVNSCNKYPDTSAKNWISSRFENCRMPKLDQEGNNWEITDERIENGRKVVYISGDFDSSDEYIDLLDRYSYVAKIDAETGIVLYVKYDYWWDRPEYIVELTNCRFEDNALQPMSTSEMKSIIKNGEYELNEYSDADIDSVGW